MSNVGENSYRPDLYGESIIVQRVVTQTSSTYNLKDNNGKNVVEKKVKEELDRILLSFNIQVIWHDLHSTIHIHTITRPMV